MKQILLILLVVNIFACAKDHPTIRKKRTDFSKEEQKIMEVARDIIKNAYYATFITIDKEGQPRARIMEPFAPEDDFEIWLATNPRSRKVTQIKDNPRVTIHYFDKNELGYVSLMGTAQIVNDNETKANRWKDGWEKFYVNQKDDYMLIRFIPERLELIDIVQGFTGDEQTWRPHLVWFY